MTNRTTKAANSRELKSERVDGREPLPLGWKPSLDGQRLDLSHQFEEPQDALEFLATVIERALERSVAPHLHHLLGGVTIGLSTPEEGVTSADRTFAAEISALLITRESH